MNLRQKTLENTFIVFAVTFFNRGVNIVTKIILARLLLPEDFGLVAIAAVILNAVSMFRELGVESALIYQKKDVDEAADTAFIIIPVIGAVLYSIVYLLAPYAADFYSEENIVGIVRISGLTLLLLSFGSVPVTLFSKELDFRKKMSPEIVSTIVYTISTITLALNGFGVWSMVYGGLLASLSGLVMIWAISSYIPKLRFNKKLALDMMDYGKYIVGAQIVIFLLTNLDNAVIGKIMGLKALGYYAMAYSISSMPATNITHILGGILFPTYSFIQGNQGKLRSMFINTVRYVSLLTFPISMGLFILAPGLIQYVLGDKWIPALPALRILCVYGLIRSINATTGDIFKAVGDPKYLRDISLIQLILVATLIIPAARVGGIEGVAILIVFNSITATILAFARLFDELNISFVFLLNSIKNQGIASTITSLVIVYVNTILPSSPTILLGSIILFGSLYFTLIFLLDKKIVVEMKELVFEAKSMIL